MLLFSIKQSLNKVDLEIILMCVGNESVVILLIDDELNPRCSYLSTISMQIFEGCLPDRIIRVNIRRLIVVVCFKVTI